VRIVLPSAQHTSPVSYRVIVKLGTCKVQLWVRANQKYSNAPNGTLQILTKGLKVERIEQRGKSNLPGGERQFLINAVTGQVKIARELENVTSRWTCGVRIAPSLPGTVDEPCRAPSN
jgi:hypothetical protein